MKPQKKAWQTRRANEKALEQKLSARAKKAWETRKSSQFKFKNESGEEKILRRELKSKAYKRSGITSGSILFMPSQTCEDVRVISKNIPNNKFRFVGSEINEAAIREIRNKIERNNYNMVIFPFSIAEIVARAGKEEYSHVDLDFCETFTRYKETLRTAIENKIVPIGGIITATFAARDVNISETACKILGKVKVKRIKAEAKAIGKKECLIVPTLTKFIKDAGGYSYKFICEPETYTDNATKQGNHMVFFILQRVK